MITAHYIHTAKKALVTAIAVWLAAYVFVVLLTYSSNDPSWSHISSDMGEISNMGGEIGAWIADLFYTFIGWSAWWMIVFIAYETLSMWWQRYQAFGFFRLVAYVFLALATSGLIAIFPMLLPIGHDTLSSAGGILGYELADRLSNLLTAYGAGAFLLLFTVLTATFAFDIHWLRLIKYVASLSWLGAGVKEIEHDRHTQDTRLANDNHETNNGVSPDEDSSQQDHKAGLKGSDHGTVAGVNRDVDAQESTSAEHGDPIFEQLALELKKQTDSYDSGLEDEFITEGFEIGDTCELNSTPHIVNDDVNDPALSNVLNEFLVNSGLGESILSLQQQEAEAKRLKSEAHQQSSNQGITTNHEAAQAKQEPSFAWNDPEAIDELLNDPVEQVDRSNSQPAAGTQAFDSQSSLQANPHADSQTDSQEWETSTPENTDAVMTPESTPSHSANGAQENSNSVSQPASTPASTSASTSDLDPSAEVVTDSATSTGGTTERDTHQAFDSDTNMDADTTPDTVNDTNLSHNTVAALETVSDSAASQVTNSAAYDPQIPDLQTYTMDERHEQIDDSIQAEPSAYSHSTSHNHLTSPSSEAPISSVNAPIDLTPTNTPPANPAKPHEPEDDRANQGKAAPTIRFATPEGDASNHIEDMVPETEAQAVYDAEQARLDKVMPELHDDAAFKSSSRAMQTAKYRESLTPIPELSILDKPDPDKKPSYTQEELTQLSELLEIKLQEFNVKAEVVNAIPGPVVTRFEVELAAGVKASKVTGISRDLARSLSMASLRVVEVIPGKPYIGIEVPNKKREMVRLIELLNTDKYKDPNAQISMAMGKDIGGKPIITDLARAPHMLVAGTTGSGKSVLVNSMLLSMLLKYKPSELRMILIDPKQLELANYNDIPHLLTPVVTDMNEAASSLSWCVAEMERRYQLMSLLKVRKLNEFNKKVVAAEKAGKPMIDPLWRPNDSVSIDQAPKLKTLPMIVIVADEFADMIMQVGKQAEELITRLAQKSRAAGIHLMLATQRPSVDVITGLIKANIPVRAALRVNSKVDSRTILDAGGAEDMLGNGDMLFLGPGQIEPDRVHGAYVSDEEVNRVCDAWRERGAPDYIDNMASNFELSSPSSGGGGNTSGEDDALYDEAVAFVMETRKVSASSIQRKFSIGYNRAARIVDSMEEAGLVSSMGKSGKRELLM